MEARMAAMMTQILKIRYVESTQIVFYTEKKQPNSSGPIVEVCLCFPDVFFYNLSVFEP